MSLQVIAFALVVAIFVIIKLLSRTDTEKIEGIPEIPGVPVFGNLLQFGSDHAKVAEQLSRRWGPVFQVKFGIKVSYRLLLILSPDNRSENCICKHIRFGPPSMDHESISFDISTKTPHVPHCSLELARIYDWDFPMGRVM